MHPETAARLGGNDCPPLSGDMAELLLSSAPASERQASVAQFIADAANAGKFDVLPWELHSALMDAAMVLRHTADETLDLEERARPLSRRERGISVWGRMVRRVVGASASG